MPDMQPHGLIPYSTVLKRFEAAPLGKLFCLHGDRSVFRLSLYAAAHALVAGVPIALVDGTNRFDAYYIAEFARRLGSQRAVQPGQLLERIYISRAFTCYQMEAAITERLPAFAVRKQTPIIIIFGLLDTYYDDQAPLFEVKSSVQRVIASLHKLKQQNYAILLASLDMKLASSERNALFPKVKGAMDEVFQVTAGEQGPRIIHETARRTIQHQQRRHRYGTNRADIHHGHTAGDGKLVEVPPRTS